MTVLDPLARLVPLAGITIPDEADTPAPVRADIDTVLRQSASLTDPDRRLVILGGFKSGKSSLVNALLGAAVAAVSPVEPSPSVQSLRVEDYVESELDAPWTVTDTPGLFHQSDLARSALDEIEHADLAILVLSAETILSAQERALARQIDDSLHGNLIFIVNRMDLVEEAERGDVAAWADRALGDHGNALIGSPRIFYMSLASGKTDLGWFVPWLNGILASESGNRIVAMSRLARLRTAANRLVATVEAQHESLRQRLEMVRAEEDRRLDDERARIRNQIAEGRGRLRACQATLDQHEETFIAVAIDDASAMLQTGETGVTVRWDSLLPRYADGISDAAHESVLGLPVTPPRFDLSDWLIQSESLSASHPIVDAGTALGDLLSQVSGEDTVRQHGIAAGRWMSRAVFGNDVEARVLKLVEAAARNRLAELRPDVEAYFDRIDSLLRDADQYFTTWTHASREITRLQQMTEGLDSIVDWASSVVTEVDAAMRDITPMDR